jgi:predicted MFS family arabinose efflux permease
MCANFGFGTLAPTESSETAERMISETRWPLVWALIFAGVVAAFQIGKAAIAVPLLRDDLGLSLTFASWVVSVYAAVGAVAGLPVGLGIKHLGARRAAVLGLLMIGIASCAGAFAGRGSVLLVTRVFEGFGFLMVAIAVPTLLRSVTADKDRDLVFACWALYFSVGSVIVMLAGPPLAEFGWQGLWLGTGLLAFGYALLVWAVAPATADQDGSGGRALADVGLVLRSPGPLLLALTFGLYSLQYHALTGLLPTLLVERLGLSIVQAGLISAVTIVGNGLGSLSAAWLLRRGIRLWVMVAAGFGFFGLASFGVFAQFMPVAGVTLLATASLAITGVIPALTYMAAPRLTPHPALLALTLGIVVQASHLGHFIGPAALGTWVENFGWLRAPVLFAAIAGIGIAAALGLRRVSRKPL